MIINTGNRTDIPAYFSEWFYNRIKDGYVYARNPYYPNQVTKYILNSKVVDCICFCTKNPEPMISRLNELKEFGQFWFVTITPYDKDIEPNVPSKEKVMESFKKLSSIIGSEKVIWRYDPIFISEKYSLKSHLENFEKMASNLSGYTEECIISFVDLYEKTKRNFPGVREVSKEEREIIGKEFVYIGTKYNINIKTCAGGYELSKFGIDCSGCMTQAVLERAIHSNLKVPKKKGSRESCDCLLGNDIGMYNNCYHGCLYCYANYSRDIVRDNFKKHDKKSPFLIGNFMEGDVIKDALQESYIDNQITFF